MECLICGNDDGKKLSCSHIACDTCTITCRDCKQTSCMECSTECETCGSSVCSSCTYVLTTCKCCHKEQPLQQHGTVCVHCVIRDWFSPETIDGFWCTACDTHCNGDGKCKVREILDSQTECPICLEDLGDTYTLQLCELHKVCTRCDYDTNRGCPLCRTGK